MVTSSEGVVLFTSALHFLLMALLPIAIGTMVVGLGITLLQSWLHWNDVSLAFIPKLLFVIGILVIGWLGFANHFARWFQETARILLP
ncbi:flagellar biosynthetic protein FliQ [Acidithiobacillus caldus]|uniref:flagellar biosynthetic protein FliQ n=1 Tax=Acidithiobacillus caldus TaxID=33059 RepID=UPI0009838508